MRANPNGLSSQVIRLVVLECGVCSSAPQQYCLNPTGRCCLQGGSTQFTRVKRALLWYGYWLRLFLPPLPLRLRSIVVARQWYTVCSLRDSVLCGTVTGCGHLSPSPPRVAIEMSLRASLQPAPRSPFPPLPLWLARRFLSLRSPN